MKIKQYNHEIELTEMPERLQARLARHLSIPVEPGTKAGTRFGLVYTHAGQAYGTLLRGARAPAGLLPFVASLAERYGEPCAVEDCRQVPEERPAWGVVQAQWREYQQEVHAAAQQAESGVVVAPPRSGKTLMGARLLDALGRPAVVVAPSVSIVAQTHRVLQEQFGASEVGRLDSRTQGREEHAGRSVVVTTPQTAVRQSPAWWRSREVLLLDEFHHCFAPHVRVQTMQGPKLISQIWEGDRVWCCSPSGCLESRPVERVWRRQGPERLLRVEAEFGTVEVSAAHQIYTEQGLRSAGTIKTGDRVWGVQGFARLQQVRRVSVVAAPPAVFDLQVAVRRNYFAEGMLVSNSAAETYHQINSLGQSIYYRYGFTGTHFRSSADALAMEAVCSRRIYSLSVTRLIKEGHLAVPRVMFVHSRSRPTGGSNFQSIYHAGIVENPDRNKQVIKLAKLLIDKGEPTIVLVRRRAHAQALGDALADYGATVVRGGEDIRGKLEGFAEGRYQCLVGTTVIGEGVDLPRARALVYASGGSASVALLQSYFRPLTAAAEKPVGRIYDFVDTHNRMLRSQSRKRIAMATDHFGSDCVWVEGQH